MKAGLYLGPDGQLVEYKTGCIILGTYSEFVSGSFVETPQVVYLCGQHKYLLAGWEYLGEL